MLGLALLAMLSVPAYAETMTVDVDGVEYEVEYTVTDMSVTGIAPDVDLDSLLISVDVTGSPGILDITFDRGFFDAVIDGADADFIVLADGDEPTSTEIEKTDQSRTFRIELPSGTEDIEVIGTSLAASEPPPEIDDTVPEEAPEEVVEGTVPEKQIPASFVESHVDPKDYVKRYVTEQAYRDWFAEHYSDYTFPEALDISESEFDRLAAEIESENSAPTAVVTPDEAEAPADMTPPAQTPPEIPPVTECGPGTILKDGACVLDESCGPGTILKDGACVVDMTTPAKAPTSFAGLGKDLGFGLIGAFILTGIIAMILGIMSKASRSGN